jgi:hypothetical protein
MRRCPLAFTPPAHAGFGIGHVGQQALAVFQKRTAFVRQRDAPRGAHQQLHAQVLLQRVEPPAHDRRRHALGAWRRPSGCPSAGHGGHASSTRPARRPVRRLRHPVRRLQVALAAEQLFPGRGDALALLWRDKQIEYTRLLPR